MAPLWCVILHALVTTHSCFYGATCPQEFRASVKIEDTQAVSEQRVGRGLKKGEGTGTPINRHPQAKKGGTRMQLVAQLCTGSQQIPSADWFQSIRLFE